MSLPEIPANVDEPLVLNTAAERRDLMLAAAGVALPMPSPDRWAWLLIAHAVDELVSIVIGAIAAGAGADVAAFEGAKNLVVRVRSALEAGDLARAEQTFSAAELAVIDARRDLEGLSR